MCGDKLILIKHIDKFNFIPGKNDIFKYRCVTYEVGSIIHNYDDGIIYINLVSLNK